MVDTHSYTLSPFGPAEQLHGGSRLISACYYESKKEDEGEEDEDEREKRRER